MTDCLHLDAVLCHCDALQYQPEQLLPFPEGQVIQALVYPSAKRVQLSQKLPIKEPSSIAKQSSAGIIASMYWAPCAGTSNGN